MIVDRYCVELALTKEQIEDLAGDLEEDVLDAAADQLVTDVIQRFNSAPVNGLRRFTANGVIDSTVRYKFEVDAVLTDLPEGAD